MHDHATFRFGDTLAVYQLDETTQQIGLVLVPASRAGNLPPPRPATPWVLFRGGDPEQVLEPVRALDPLVQIKLAGDASPGGFAQGHTLTGSASVQHLRFESQRVERDACIHSVITTLRHPAGLRVEHRLRWAEGALTAGSSTTVTNDGPAPLVLELLSSFSLGGISPFQSDDATGRLKLHRFRSAWSAEGRLETRSLEELHLERSWSGSATLNERFGQIGSMPVRKWFPFVALEDTAAGVVWAAQLAWAGSWQLEVHRRFDNVALTGGLADREFGHWTKTLSPGEAFTTPVAHLACVCGGIDDAADRLTRRMTPAVDAQPSVEHDLPVVFNEFCTTWGNPQHDVLLALARRLQGTPVRYLVIDAGWYRRPGSTWANGHGDWRPNPELFPDGIEATAAAIRAHGLIPGLWFELETCGQLSDAFAQTTHQLKRDGIPITAKGRRFWDLNDPWVLDYLEERVVGLLDRGGFGYVKIDYNETIGLGCDGAESPGEGLRRRIEGTWRFFDRLRARLPELVVENCASGGHRLESSMLERSAMSSFSDAHELSEIPIIAAALHRLVLPRQSQVWAVLRPSDSDQRLVYSLAAGFLGRLCLSGDITALNPEQWALVSRALALYPRVAPIIRDGTSTFLGDVGPSWRHPRGWQAVLRRHDQELLVVLHTFAGPPPRLELPLPPGKWCLLEELSSGPASHVSSTRRCLRTSALTSFSGRVIRLRC